MSYTCYYCTPNHPSNHMTISRHRKAWYRSQNVNPSLFLTDPIHHPIDEQNASNASDTEQAIENTEDNTNQGLQEEIIDDFMEDITFEEECNTASIRPNEMPDIGFHRVNEATQQHLRLLHLAEWVDNKISRKKYEELRNILKSDFKITLPWLRRRSEQLSRITELYGQRIDCCINGCMAFTGKKSTKLVCDYCHHERFKIIQPEVEPSALLPTTRQEREDRQVRKVPYQTFLYIPLAQRLEFQYRSKRRAKTLEEYAKTYLSCPIDQPSEEISDWWSGKRCTQLRKEGFFRKATDIALALHYDGVNVVDRTLHSMSPVILINYNLPPSIRSKQNNILLSMLIPGPDEPKDLSSFLRPLVDEMKVLGTGIVAKNAYKDKNFVLKAHIVLAGGDGPAVCALCGTKRPGAAIQPCRFCRIKSTKAPNGRYYPVHAPMHLRGHLLKRTNLRTEIIEGAALDNAERTLRGTAKPTCLLELPTLHFPDSFPIDLMHLIPLNIMKNLWRTWLGEKLTADQDPTLRGSYILAKEVRDEKGFIQSSLHNARKTMPLANGSVTRKFVHFNTLKAAEWQDFLEVYGITLMYENLPDYRAHQNLCQLYEIWRLATRRTISIAQIAELERRCQEFLAEYQAIYYQGIEARIPAMSINHHWLLHLADCIANNGPGCYHWSYPLERFCFEIKALGSSKSKLSLSTSNSLLRREQLNHVFLLDIDISRRHPDMPDPTPYPVLDSRLKVTKERWRLNLEALTMLNRTLGSNSNLSFGDVTYYKRCKVSAELTIGSIASQIRSETNRADHFICYAFGSIAPCNFGSIHSFFETPTRRIFALVRRWNGVERDTRVHQITTAGVDGAWQTVEPKDIICIVGFINENDKNTADIMRMIVGKPILIDNVEKRGLEKP